MMNGIRIDVGFPNRIITILLCGFLWIISLAAHAIWHPIDIQDERVLFDPPHIYVEGNTLYFDGKIDEDTDTVVIALIKKNNIKKISINSIGGSIVPAMNIGLIIHQRKIDIEVRSVCASACANYLFPAGINKKLAPDSYLLWHGSAHSPKAEFTINSDQEKITRKQFFSAPEFIAMKKMERDFYHTIGVQYKIGFCPQRLKDYHQRFPEKWFSYSEKDLQAFGVKRVFYVGGEEKWRHSMKEKGVIFAAPCR